MGFAVRLSIRDFLDAVEVSAERMRASARRGLDHANVSSREPMTRLHNEIVGAAAELAVARWLGIDWSRSVNTFHGQADVGEDIDVRCTTRADGRLIVRENDEDYRWFLLVTGTPPNMVLRGYIRGYDAKQPEWLGNPHDWRLAWFVPQVALIPITSDGAVPPCLRQVLQRASVQGAAS